jgi:hypothetical protein
MTFIPGFITLKFSKVNLESKVQTLVYGFALSLLINYLLVYFFTVLGIYKPLTIYGIIFIEMILLLVYMKKSGHTTIDLNIKRYFTRFKDFLVSKPLTYHLLLFLSIVMIGIFLYIFLSRIKAVFYLNDPVLGWNRFALDWYQNRLPVRTAHYPQLIPANWSMAYVILQNSDIQCVARSIMSFFPIGISFLLLDLGLRKRNATYFWALILYGIILTYLYRPVFIAGGYVDIAVSFFAFLSFYVLHNADNRTFCIKHCIWSIVFASAAAVTKQAGLYILLIVFAWNVWILYKNRASLLKKNMAKAVVLMLLLISVIVASWYIYRQVQINRGIEPSEIHAATSRVHGNRSYGERFIYGFNKILFARGKNKNNAFFVYSAIFLLLLGLFHKKTRFVMLFIVIPFTLIWGFLYSYSYRNLTMAFPFMALSMAFGSFFLIRKLHVIPAHRLKQRPPQEDVPKEEDKKLQHVPGFKRSISILYFGFFILLLLIVLNFTVFKKDLIIKNQLAQQMNIGNKRLNKKLYRYYEENGFEGSVYSQYDYFRFLPLLRKYWTPDWRDSDVRYLLCDLGRYRSRWKVIRKYLKKEEYTVLFSIQGFRFIKVKK